MRKLTVKPSEYAWKQCAADVESFYALSKTKANRKYRDAALKHLRLAYAYARQMGENVL